MGQLLRYASWSSLFMCSRVLQQAKHVTLRLLELLRNYREHIMQLYLHVTAVVYHLLEGLLYTRITHNVSNRSGCVAV